MLFLFWSTPEVQKRKHSEHFLQHQEPMGSQRADRTYCSLSENQFVEQENSLVETSTMIIYQDIQNNMRSQSFIWPTMIISQVISCGSYMTGEQRHDCREFVWTLFKTKDEWDGSSKWKVCIKDFSPLQCTVSCGLGFRQMRSKKVWSSGSSGIFSTRCAIVTRPWTWGIGWVIKTVRPVLTLWKHVRYLRD